MGRLSHSVLQLLAILLISLIAGSTFGIWRGYNPAFYSQATFVEVHQQVVRGLNVLLPALGMGALVLTGVLAFLARRRPRTLLIYVAAIVLMVTAALITRFINQPINAEIMTWVDAIPVDWQEVRDTWWRWHVIRMVATIAAEIALVSGVLGDRER